MGQENTDDNSNKAFSTRLAYTFPRNNYYDILEIGASFLDQTITNSDRLNIYNSLGRGLHGPAHEAGGILQQKRPENRA